MVDERRLKDVKGYPSQRKTLSPPTIAFCYQKVTFVIRECYTPDQQGNLAMRNWIVCLFLLFSVASTHAQTFTVTGSDTIPDNNTTVYYDILVSGLPSVIDTNFGLQTACLNMYHTYCSDMEVKIQAPDGTTAILFSGIGGGDDDFLNTCLEGVGTSITAGTAPFTGTWKAQGPLGNVNNGQNPNGIWRLVCRDMAGADIGILTSRSLTFSSNPARPFMFLSSNLPIVKLTTVSSPIVNDPKVPVHMQIIDNGPNIRNYVSQTNYAFEGTIMAELQGFTGPSYPKKNYDFEVVDAFGANLDTTLLGLPREHDWMFKAEYLDHSLLKNMVTYTMAERMGVYAPRTRMCEVILDGDYIGYFTLTEKVKRDANRVDIAKMTSNDLSGQALTGGYMIEMNINGNAGAWNSIYPPINSATCSAPVEFKFVYPKAADIEPTQAAYIHAYVDTFENVMNGPNFADPINGYRKYADIHTFIDFLIVNEYSVNYDSYGRSTYMYKEKITDGGLLKIGPPWDYDRAIEWTNPGLTDGWVWEITHPYWPFPFWWSKWWTEADYRHQLACRWTMLRQETLSTDSFMALIDSFETRINEAADRNFTVWNDLGGQSYQDQVDSLRSFLTRRLNWIDATLALENPTPPSFYLPTDTVVCAGTVYDAGFNGSQYSYNWQPGPDTTTITLAASGIQTLQVTDRWGCYARKEMDVTISQPDAGFGTTQVGTGLDWAFTANDQNATSYAWTFGDGGTDSITNPTHPYSSDGTYIVTLTLVDSIGCTGSFTDTIQFIHIGTPEMANWEGEIYPNPFTDKLQLVLNASAKSPVELQLLNELGQTVLTQTFKAGTQRMTLATGHLPAGMYLLQVRMGDQTAVRKVMRGE
jgi:subtilisin-like proprotein convertase family protein